jgi:uncharacterized membrane protein YccF (DUF307 family)
MRLLLNVIWLVFAGIWAFIAWALAAIVMVIPIITIPFAIQAAKIAVFSLWPFGRTMVKRRDAGLPSLLGNILWFVLCGWWLAIIHFLAGIALCLTIIGIPLGLGNFKLIPVSVWPMGREIVNMTGRSTEGGLVIG